MIKDKIIIHNMKLMSGGVIAKGLRFHGKNKPKPLKQ